jgi:hypothetical protein
VLDSLADHARTDVLLELAVYLPTGPLPKWLEAWWSPRDLLRAVHGIVSPAPRLRAFRALAARLPDELISEAEAVLAGFRAQEDRIRALAALAPRLSGARLKQALELVRAIPQPPHKTRALVALAQHLSASEREELLTAARELPSLGDRVETLVALSGQLPPRLQRLAWDEAAESFRQMHDPAERSAAVCLLPFAEIAPYLWPTLEAAIELPNGLQRRVILERLAPCLAQLEPTRMSQAWQSALPILTRRSRGELLADTRALLPALVRLGGRGSWVKVGDAIERVREWWR